MAAGPARPAAFSFCQPRYLHHDMKTLTEFAGVILRNAAKIREEQAAAGLQGEELNAAVARELGFGEDRMQRLLEALEVAGSGKLDSVRLVRVYQGEDAPPNAKAVGEFRYVVDRLGKVRSPRADEDGRKPRRRGRGPGGDGRPQKGRGGGRPGRPGPDGARGNQGRPNADRPGLGRGDGRPPGRGSGRPRGGPPGRGRGRRDGDSRGRGGEKLPSSGAGWSLTRAPREGGERRGRGGPRRSADNERGRPRGDRRGRERRESGERRGHRQRPPQETPRREPSAPARAEAPTAAAPPPRAAKSPPPARPRPEATASSPDGLVQRRPSTRPAHKPGKRRGRRRGRGSAAADGNRAAAPPTDVAGDRPQPGNEALPEAPEPNGNVAPGPSDDIDDSFGNR